MVDLLLTGRKGPLDGLDGRRCNCNWRSIELVILMLSLLSFPRNFAAASFLSHNLFSPGLCKLPVQSHAPPSFAIVLSGQSPTLHPQQHRQCQRPKPASSALEFWTRAGNGHEIIDDNLKNAKLSDEGSSDGETNEDDVLPTNSTLEPSILVDTSVNGDVSPESNHSNNEIEVNTTVMADNNTSFENVLISTDDITVPTKWSRWKRISSIPGVLPGKPIFMRLMPIRSNEIISKIMEETPVQKDLQIDSEETVPSEREEIDSRGLDLGDQGSNSEAAASTNESNDGEPQSNVEDEGLESSEHPYNTLNTRALGNSSDSQETSSIISSTSNSTVPTKTVNEIDGQDREPKKRSRFFRRRSKQPKDDSVNKIKSISKEELECPVIATNIRELQSAVLIDKVPLRDVGFRFPAKGLGSDIVLGQGNGTIASIGGDNNAIFLRDDPLVNGSLSSLLTCGATSSSNPDVLDNYQRGIDLINLHPVLSIVRERVKNKSKPGDRQLEATSPGGDTPHLALVIEGGGMRGAVSAGMAAALSTLDLLDAFDSIHGSSAGSIVGAYLVSRQLCTDIYTEIMPKAGSKFASSRRGMINFGVDWLGDLLTSSSPKDGNPATADDGFCAPDDEMLKGMGDNTTLGWCGDEGYSSVELAMGGMTEKRLISSSISDDHYDGVLFESANYLLSNTFSFAKSTVAKPLSFGVRRFGRVLKPALSAFDFASSMREYLRRRPGMNLTYVLDGVMDETHGLRPFDVNAFKANDQRQPLYIIASTVDNGGKGEMETVAFNSKEGDFFGSAPENDTETGKESVSWYKKLWAVFKFVPYSIFSAFFSAGEFTEPLKDSLEAEIVPPGSNAMYGFTNRHKIRNLSRPKEEDKAYDPTGRINDEGKKGFFPCLEASMLVPGAAGPPIQLIRSKNRKFIEQRSRFPRFRPKQELNRRKETNSHLCYDAFCYEPIPYRSAVEKANATHVLALRSRPDGCEVETRQHMYERVVGPIYFRKHGMLNVAKLFTSGGSQYRYMEDVLTLNEGLTQGIAMGRNDVAFSGKEYSKGVRIPPTKLFYDGNDMTTSIPDMDSWKQAHLLPITLPFATPELPALSQDKDEVVKAVRSGYAAAFDVLADVAGLSFDSKSLSGEKVAKILFPDGDDDIAVLNNPVKVKPSYIGEDIGEDEEESKRRSFAAWIRRKREAKRKAKDEIKTHPGGVLAQRFQRRSSTFHETDQYVRDDSNTLEYIETEALLAALPGFRGGRLDHIADNLLAKEERKKKS